MSVDGEGSSALLRAVSLLVTLSESKDPNRNAARVREVVEPLERVELLSLVAALAGLAAWSIESLVPLAIPGQDPGAWIRDYIPAALKVVDGEA